MKVYNCNLSRNNVSTRFTVFLKGFPFYRKCIFGDDLNLDFIESIFSEYFENYIVPLYFDISDVISHSTFDFDFLILGDLKQ